MENAVAPHVLDEGVLVAGAVVAVLDPDVVAGDPPQPHDLAHRVNALRAGVDALEAVGARVQAVLVLGQRPQPRLLLGVARIADEAVGLGQGGRSR